MYAGAIFAAKAADAENPTYLKLVKIYQETQAVQDGVQEASGNSAVLLKTPVADLVAQADEVAPPLPIEDAHALLDDESTLFVDIREPQEWAREGILPGAYRAPRGMLEFWVDPESPYYKASLDDGRTLAGLKVLGELSRHLQIIVLTHHEHLLPLAQQALGKDLNVVRL